MKILIIEDEQSSADRLRRMLENDHEIVGLCTSNAEVSAFFADETHADLDLILSDIQLGDGLSFESLRTAPTAIPVIFTTAFDHYAVQAFKFNSIDYLLKPIDEAELHVALEKVNKSLASCPSTVNSQLSTFTVGELVLSPTRTYAPVIKKILDQHRKDIHGMVHCTGGAQTKVLHFVGENCRVVKDNMFPVPPLFRIIHDCSQTNWREMYQVFNMGHRMEIYVRPELAEKIIDISRSFNIDAQVVGHIEEGAKSLTIQSEFGEFNY